VSILLAYALALFVAAVTPGPAMFAVISSGVGRGTPSALAFALGVAIGDTALVSLALVGLTVVAQTFGWLFVAIKYGGALYLIA
ncbi:LysE family transporter, partial [Mycobacterium tuberculosis]|nr:LysE family transporter [Mycobacterium tuberculosis]